MRSDLGRQVDAGRQGRRCCLVRGPLAGATSSVESFDSVAKTGGLYRPRLWLSLARLLMSAMGRKRKLAGVVDEAGPFAVRQKFLPCSISRNSLLDPAGI